MPEAPPPPIDPGSEPKQAERIGYFGGTFDPPHRGHLAVARAARDHFRLDRVLLAPTGRQPLKPGGPEAPWPDRLQMTALLCAAEPGLEASAIDAPRPTGEPNYTADTLRRLHASFANEASDVIKLFAILGADAFLGIGQWRDPEALFRLADWIVVSRPEFPLPDLDGAGLPAAARGRVHLLGGVADPLSATALRARLHQRLPCPGLITPTVMEQILSRNLYL